MTIARLAAIGLLAVAPAAVAQVVLSNAWLRPAAAGQQEAQVYVDIRSAEPVTLVAARSPIAKRAELVVLDPPQPDTGRLRVVSEMAMPAGETRLAYRGSHVRLVGVARAADPGDRVPIELTFVDASGRRTTATTDALVRGLVARRPDAGAAPAPPAK